MTGGGFGGSALALGEQTATAEVIRAVTDSAVRQGHPKPVQEAFATGLSIGETGPLMRP
jgi:galactokinase